MTLTQRAMIPLFLAVLSVLTPRAHADSHWQMQAHLLVPQPGVCQAILPPALYDRLPDGRIDLALTGPDGQSRPFEIFWREQSGFRDFTLTPANIELTDSGTFIWEAEMPDHPIEKISVTIAGSGYLGQVDIDGKVQGKWKELAQNAALYRAGGRIMTRVAIPRKRYNRIRLRFRSVDKRNRKQILPIDRVTASGSFEGRDRAEEHLSPLFLATQSGDHTEIRTTLPGRDTLLKEIRFDTEIQFQGEWQMGYESITNGKRTFHKIYSGIISHVRESDNTIQLPINRAITGNALVIRLDPKGHHLGAISNLTVTLLMPRIVFHANLPGNYTARTGTGRKQEVSRYPMGSGQRTGHPLLFSVPTLNPERRLASLIERYDIQGGPFHKEGFRWSAPIQVPEPGYFRLPLNLRASLDPNREGIMLEKGGMQVPFFIDRYENRTTQVPFTQIYHKDKNRTVWTLDLPAASPWWHALEVSASGFFSRNLELSARAQGNLAQKEVTTLHWENRHGDEETLRISLHRLPREEKRLEIAINHGNNRPMELTAIQAVYQAPSLCFLAREPGTYRLFGGKPHTATASYDLSLVRSQLLKSIPQELAMHPITPIRQNFGESLFPWITAHKRGVLYSALALTALVLLAMIVKMFPAAHTMKDEP